MEVEEVVGVTVGEVEAEDVAEVCCVSTCLASMAHLDCFVGARSLPRTPWNSALQCFSKKILLCVAS